MITQHERRVPWLAIGVAVLAIIVILGGLLALATLGMPAFGFGSGPYSVMFWGWGIMFVMMFAMLLFGILIIGGIIALVVWAIRAFGPQLGRRQDEALAILDQRFARGEINPEEYQTRRRELVESRR